MWDGFSRGALVDRVVDGGRVRVYETDVGLQSCACEILRSYEGDGESVLVRFGYLDLAGSVWSCTVRCRDRVEICFVCERSDGEGCVVRVLSMEGSEWEDMDGLSEGKAVAG